jgi:small subunit ribosomal protein S13
MARIAGVDLPKNKQIGVSLTYIFGIGNHTARKLLAEAEVAPETRTDKLTAEEVGRIRSIIDERVRVEGDLRKDVTMNIKRLMDIGSYRGLRHRRGLPARGQSTHSNARTRKGPRKTVAGKKKAPGKK